ncbi:MAG: hypothetical protein IH892_16890, partial [Planctomycetes bacterium]|nr:hypothetical protein [Planctomycetota bacterium]
MSKQSFRPTVLCIFGLLLLATSSVSAVETFKTSNIAGGHQIWFEVEDFDERDPADDSSFAVVDEPGAFGQAISSISGSNGQSLIRYTFDISKAGGSGGTWYFWGRVINPSNQSDYMVVEGHPGDPTSFVLPVSGLVNGQRIFEQNEGPPWTWTNPNHEEAHTKTLRDGENTMYIVARQTGALWDVFMWTDDPGYVPTDADYENAEVPSAGAAGGPSPGNDAADVPWYINELSWSAGDFAKTHNVYFGANFADVNDRAASALVGEGLTDTSQAMQTDLETTYYWAVDEVNGAPDFTVHAGDTWSFTVESVANLVTNVSATADSQFGADNGPGKVVDGSGLADGLHGTTETDMWLSTGLPATIQFDFDQVYSLHEMQVWNQNQLIEFIVGFGAKDIILEVSANGTDFTAVDGVGPLNQAPGTNSAANTTIALNGVQAMSVRMTITSAHGFLAQAGLSEVQFTAIPAFPREFSPADGADLDDPDVTLSWRAGRFTVEHQVLLSQDQAAVADGSAVIATTADKSHALSGLEYGKVYFNQIIDVAADGTTYPGPINVFVTPGSQAVDDMESYKDEENLEIWATWVDGFGDEANNGALVGTGPSGNEASSSSYEGSQSLPIAFDTTTAAVAEATRTFNPSLDVTVGAPDNLGIYFQGGPAQFVENPDGSVTMAGIGADIHNMTDEFNFAYKELTGDGSITVKAESLQDVHTWAKAGVMIRNSLDPSDLYVHGIITPRDRVEVKFREVFATNTGGGATPENSTPFPHWLRLTRTGNSFSAQHSADGVTWEEMHSSSPVTLLMLDPVVIGLAVTSHTGVPTVAEFSNITVTGNVSAGWRLEEMTVEQPDNGAASVYLTVTDSAGQSLKVSHPDPAATNLTGWTLLNIPFSDMGGLNLSSIRSITFGVEDSGAIGTVLADYLHVSVASPSADEVLSGLSNIGASPDDVVTWFEAESGAPTAPLEILDDPAASGSQYVAVPNGTGSSTGQPPADGLATYPLTLPEDGVYRLAFRVIAPSGSDDSFWVRIPGMVTNTLNHVSGWVRFIEIQPGDSWHWDEVHSRDDDNEVV